MTNWEIQHLIKTKNTYIIVFTLTFPPLVVRRISRRDLVAFYVVLPTLGQPQRASPRRNFSGDVLELYWRITSFKSVLSTGWSALDDFGVTRCVIRSCATSGMLALTGV